MNGVLNILKPPGMTSHDIVYYVRKRAKTKKVGHTGTLDPEAAGVLPICIGKATKAVQYITDKNKKYRANIKFGIVTDTYDKYGKIISQKTVPIINKDMLMGIFKQFIGKIEQIPPIYSAIKVEGKKLYQYALEGESIEIQSRKVEIYDIQLIDIISADEVMLDVHCSKGTYIRSLCYDIGEVIGCGAHMSQLVRLESAPFTINDSYTIEEIDKAASENKLIDFIKPVDSIFINLEVVIIKPSARNSIMNGNPIYEMGIIEGLDKYQNDTMVRIYDNDEFLGLGLIVYSCDEDRKYLKVKKLLI